MTTSGGAKSSSESERFERTAHYIFPLPSGEMPKKVLWLIKSIDRTFGRVFVNMYQSPEPIRWVTRRVPRGYGGFRETVKWTHFWVEISSRPLKLRKDGTWPLRKDE